MKILATYPDLVRPISRMIPLSNVLCSTVIISREYMSKMDTMTRRIKMISKMRPSSRMP